MEETDLTVDNRPKPEDIPDIVIITGMSGAGRTESMHVFEDLGYFCVDNIPSGLIPKMVEMRDISFPEDNLKLAVVCDARNGRYLESLLESLDTLRKEGREFSMIFLDASDSKLISRYKASRRRHPLCVDGTTIAQGIIDERMMLSRLKSESNIIIDTTDMMPQQLRRQLMRSFSSQGSRKGLAVTVFSFGFKHGEPTDADLVIDVRFLPNPYYIDDLKPLTGLDEPVRDYVMLRDETIEFNKKWHDLLDVIMPGYVNEGKQQLAIGIGCTGGQHRSVAIAESTGDYLKSKGYRVSVAHRDMSLSQASNQAKRKTGIA